MEAVVMANAVEVTVMTKIVQAVATGSAVEAVVMANAVEVAVMTKIVQAAATGSAVEAAVMANAVEVAVMANAAEVVAVVMASIAMAVIKVVVAVAALALLVPLWMAKLPSMVQQPMVGASVIRARIVRMLNLEKGEKELAVAAVTARQAVAEVETGLKRKTRNIENPESLGLSK